MGDVYIILWNVFIRDEYLNGSVCIYILRYLRNWKIVNEIMYIFFILVILLFWIIKNVYEFLIEIDYLFNFIYCCLIIKNEKYWFEINMNKFYIIYLFKYN